MATEAEMEAIVKRGTINLNRAVAVLQSVAPVGAVAELFNALEGLLEIAEEAMPSSFFQTDRRTTLATKVLGFKTPVEYLQNDA